MPAALQQKTFLDGTPNRPAEINSGDRTSRPGAGAPGFKRNRKGWPTVAFLQARRDQPYHTGMPSLRRSDDHSALLFESQRCEGLSFGLRHRRLLDLLALAIKAVKLGSDARGLIRILLQKEAHPEIGAPNAPAGIDSWTQ